MNIKNNFVKPQVPGYDIYDKIGSGSYGTVYRAQKKDYYGDTVAIKIIPKKSLTSEFKKESLLTEIELLKKLKHPHILNLFEFLHDNSCIYLVTEFCSGGDLSQYLKLKKIISENITKYFLKQLASALELMRSRGVGHFDLKPSNILLSSHINPILKIADFGFARYIQGTKNTDIYFGSLLYMPPEMVNQGICGEKGDLWSLGVILYECLFGKAPFSSSTLKQIHFKIHSNKPIQVPETVSEECRNLLSRLLERDFLKRINFIDFFNHPFVGLRHDSSFHFLEKAGDLWEKGEILERKGNFKESFQACLESIQDLIQAIKYESNPEKKIFLRKKVNEYIKKTEKIKILIKEIQNQQLEQQLNQQIKTNFNQQQQQQIESILHEKQKISQQQKIIREQLNLLNHIKQQQQQEYNSLLKSHQQKQQQQQQQYTEQQQQQQQQQQYTEQQYQQQQQQKQQKQQEKQSTRQTSSLFENYFNELVILCGEDKELKRGIDLIQHAKNQKDLSDNCSLALYQEAIGIFIEKAKKEPTGRRKQLIHFYVSDWLMKAELMKEEEKLRKLREINEKDRQKEEEINTINLKNPSTCSLQ